MLGVALCAIFYLRFKKQKLDEINYILETTKVSVILLIVLCGYCYVNLPKAPIISFDYPNGLKDIQSEKLLKLLQNNNAALVQLTETLHFFFIFFIVAFLVNYFNLIKVIKKIHEK